MKLHDFFFVLPGRFVSAKDQNEFQCKFSVSLGANTFFLGAVLTLAILLVPTPASARMADICDQAAHRAASEFDIPFAVLWSLTRTETGRPQNGELKPWPWTVNMEGDGHWFDTEQEARAFASKEFNRGARSFDIGCFQINFKWHGASFRSLDQMFDPYENARYAAAFLARLYRESGNWSEAVGTYHSRTPEFANIYKARFNRIRNSYDGDTDTTIAARGVASQRTVSRAARENSYPLLAHAGSTLSNGSLVPLQRSGGTSFIAMPGRLGGS